MSSRQDISNIVEFLKKTLSRPYLFMWTNDNVHDADLYLAAFHSACLALGHAYSVDIESAVFQAHGYERRADGVMSQLIAGGLSNEQIVHILIQFEIEKWQLRLLEIESES